MKLCSEDFIVIFACHISYLETHKSNERSEYSTRGLGKILFSFSIRKNAKHFTLNFDFSRFDF